MKHYWDVLKFFHKILVQIKYAAQLNMRTGAPKKYIAGAMAPVGAALDRAALMYSSVSNIMF